LFDGGVAGSSFHDNQQAEGGAPMRRGLTLIECLVIVAVLGVLVCLLLPALSAAQDEARKERCVNNLRHFGLAMHNYHQTNDCFPMSAVVGDGHGLGHSCFTGFLPFMEQSRLYNGYNYHLENWHVANGTVVGTRVATFTCPDNPNTQSVPARDIRTIDGNSYPGTSAFAPLHYGANWGGNRAGWADAFEKGHGTFRGVMMTIRSRGPDGENTNVRLAQITDGTSYTVAIGEKRDSQGWCVGGWAGSEFDPGPSPAYDGDDPTTRRVFTGSSHGDPHILFCDGAVRPLPGTIDRELWYALLTRNGREAIDLRKLPAPAGAGDRPKTPANSRD
jgi:type II secretory pathway pseudopilin PulG